MALCNVYVAGVPIEVIVRFLSTPMKLALSAGHISSAKESIRPMSLRALNHSSSRDVAERLRMRRTLWPDCPEERHLLPGQSSS